MAKRTDDRGVRKTKRALRDGLASLLEHKDIKDITVKELTEYVDINRGTFYYHYNDIYDLQQEIEAEIIQEINSFLLINNMNYSLELFNVLLQYIEENVSIIRMFLSNNSRSSTFISELEKQLVQEWQMNRILKGLEDKSYEMTYYVHFIVSGHLAILSHWIESGMNESIEQVAALMERINTKTINF